MKNPKTFNEKILTLKLKEYSTNDLIKQCADKYRVRDYVKNAGCEQLLVPLIAVYDDPRQIEWDVLPRKFAMKWNFGCGYNVICKEKDKLDKYDTLQKMNKWGDKGENYYLSHSEMQYKGMKGKILVEEFLDEGTGALPEDYKFYCMNGICQTIMVCKDRKIGKKASYYWMNRNWELLPYSREAIENPQEEIPKPQNLDEAIDYAEKLAKPFKFVRVDFYIIKGRIYFGELTFTPAGGMDIDLLVVPPNQKRTVDEILGDTLKI